MPVCHLDDDVSFSGAGAVQLAVFLHHHYLAFLLHLLHVLLHLVEDAAVVLLGYAHKLDRKGAKQQGQIRFCLASI